MQRPRIAIVELILVVVVAGLPSTALAERYPEDRKTAEVILKGRVEAIDETWSLEHDHYRVRLRVEEVERGPAIVPGDAVTIACLGRQRLPIPGLGGHSSIPDLGDRIRAFARPSGGDWVGNYPDWYDLIQPSDRGWLVRAWGRRKFRLICTVAAIGLGGCLAWCLVRTIAKRRDSRTQSGRRVKPAPT
jgi:hypothetical protein